MHLHSNTAPYEYYLPEWHTPSLFFTLDAPVVMHDGGHYTDVEKRMSAAVVGAVTASPLSAAI